MSIFQQQQQPKATFEVINQNVARFLSTTLQSGYFLAPKNKEEEDTYPTFFIRCTFVSTPFKVRFQIYETLEVIAYVK